MVHLHEVRDTDSHYVIDPITRAITNANSAKNTLMQGDHNSEIYTFEIPRYVEGHDMTLCNAIRIHFNDISADKANESRDFYPVEDMHIDETHTDTLVFSWLVSGNATMYAGLLSFRIQFLCINDSGVVTYKWHTDVFKGITISDGFDNSEAAIEEYSDVIAKWEAELFGAGDSVIENIQNAAGEQIASIEEARNTAVSAVEAKGAETLATIPDDYTELYGMANDAVRTRANAIVENVEGNAITANDCSGDYLRGLRVFGKSAQDGEPSPEHPQEINSVENAVVTISGNGVEDQTVTIPRALHGIPVSSGGNYTDANGQQWICDEVDLARGVYVQRCAHYVFDGSDDEAWRGVYSHEDKPFAAIDVLRGSVQYTTPMLCNYALNKTWSAENVCFINNYDEFFIGGIPMTSVLSDIDTFRQHIAETPIEVIYVLETPIETALPDEEIFNFSQLHSNYPNTTVLNDTGAWMEVAYNADTELYFNNSRGATDEQVQKSVDAWLTANLAIAEEVSF